MLVKQIHNLRPLMSAPSPATLGAGMNFGFYSILFVTRIMQELEEPHKRYSKIANVLLDCLESEEADQRWSLWENFSLTLWDWPLLPLCFYSKGSTPASGQDLLCRHRDCHTLERLHGGGCRGRGESGPRDPACHGEDSRGWSLAVRTRVCGRLFYFMKLDIFSPKPIICKKSTLVYIHIPFPKWVN